MAREGEKVFRKPWMEIKHKQYQKSSRSKYIGHRDMSACLKRKADDDTCEQNKVIQADDDTCELNKMNSTLDPAHEGSLSSEGHPLQPFRLSTISISLQSRGLMAVACPLAWHV